MSIEMINEKPLTEIREEEEQKKFEVQGDIFEVVAMLYEELEANKARITILEGGVK